MDNLLISDPWTRLALFSGLGMVIGLALSILLGGISKRSKRVLISRIAGQLRAIAFITFFIIGVGTGIWAFDYSVEMRATISNTFTVALYIIATWSAVRVYDVVHELFLVPWGQRRDNKPVIDVLRILASVLIWTLGVLSALNSAGYQVSAILAGLGIGGLAFALAAQDAIANIFGGFIILAQSPFKVGDQITVGEHNGWVLNIGLRSTLIQSWLGHYITIPNKKFTDSPITNVDKRTLYWEELRLMLHHDSNIDQIEQAIALVEEILTSSDDLGETRWVGLSALKDGCPEIEVWYGIEKFNGESDSFPNEYMKILGTKSAIQLRVLRALESNGIRLALPIERRIVGGTPTPPSVLGA